jgi:hypothetical protein
MTDWTDGDIANTDANFSYYPELNPLRLRLAFLNTGLHFPEIGTACELGFAQGVSVNLHAAASVTQWFGTEINPAHTQFAQQIAQISGADAQLFDQAFTEFCSRADLPDFDYIALHGLWNWVNDENHALIVDFIQRKLKVGGVVYVSYDTQAGWSTLSPVRDLLAEHADIMGTHGQGGLARFDSAVNFVQNLLATNPSYLRANPNILAQFKKLSRNKHQQYLNQNWQPLSFSQTAHLLLSAKLSFACSAHYLDHIDTLNLTDDQQDFLADIPDDLFRETVRDFCVNQSFRRDYWIKGAVRLNLLEQTEAIRAQRLVLGLARENVLFKVTGNLGESVLHPSIYAPILDVLSDYQVKTLGQIEQTVAESGINFGQLIQATMILIGAGVLFPAQSDAIIAEAKQQTNQLNAYLCNKARGSNDLSYLASPVTGGGISVPRFSQLFLLAKAQGNTQSEQWAAFAWAILAAQNQRLVKDGVILESDNENLIELTLKARVFADKQLPVLIALGVCD